MAGSPDARRPNAALVPHASSIAALARSPPVAGLVDIAGEGPSLEDKASPRVPSSRRRGKRRATSPPFVADESPAMDAPPKDAPPKENAVQELDLYMADEAELAARANAPPTPPYRHKTRILIPDDDSGDESPREMAPPMDEAFGEGEKYKVLFPKLFQVNMYYYPDEEPKDDGTPLPTGKEVRAQAKKFQNLIARYMHSRKWGEFKRYDDDDE